MAKEATAQIQLAAKYDKPVTLSYGSRSIKAEPGKPVEVSESDARAWISTKKFVRVEAEKPATEEASESSQPAEGSGPSSIEELMKKTKGDLVIAASQAGITPEEADKLKKQELAELILKTTEESN